jgi:mannitol-1-phosphate 5-dehydrogenase
MPKHQICLAVGAGAIGKSVTGPAFRDMGLDVVFADVSAPVVRDIEKRNGYRIKTAHFHKKDEWRAVQGVRALPVDSREAQEIALCADYLCTSVGTAGLRALLPTLLDWIERRNAGDSDRLHLLFFENESHCVDIVREALLERMGAVPPWLVMAKASIERMTKPLPPEDGRYDVVAERVFPIFLPRREMSSSPLAGDPRFELVDDIDAYYYRKLYTNNLGHAALGYVGWRYGYRTAIQTMPDERVCAILRQALEEAGKMLVAMHGFSQEAMRAHLDELPERFWNPGLDDDLGRLSRDPIRKLGPDERIVGAMKKCRALGIDPRGIVQVFCHALRYDDPSDPSARRLQHLRRENTTAWVIQNIAGISPEDPLYPYILEADAALTAAEKYQTT